MRWDAGREGRVSVQNLAWYFSLVCVVFCLGFFWATGADAAMSCHAVRGEARRPLY
jgi:hypothetical protein